MNLLHFHRLLEFLASIKLVMGMLWLGLAAFTLCLAILMYSRWGQSKPLRKCMALSLLAHLLLAGYSTTIEIVSPEPQPVEHVFHVSFQDDSAANSSEKEVSGGTSVAKGVEQPWEMFPSEDVAPPEQPELERQVRDVAEMPERHGRAEENQLVGEPVSTHMPIVNVKMPVPKLTASERSEERSASPEKPQAIDAPIAQHRDSPKLPVDAVAFTKQREAIPSLPQPMRESKEDASSPLLQALGPMPKMASDSNEEDFPSATVNPIRSEPVILRSAKRLTSIAAEPDPAYGGSAESSGSEPMNGEKTPKDPDAGAIAMAMVANASSQATDAPNAENHALSGHAKNLDASKVEPGKDGNSKGEENVIPDAYRLRMIPNHADLVLRKGCSAETESAVKSALKWFAENQASDGRWIPRDYGAGKEMNLLGHSHQNAGSKADTGVTGLVLLAYLAAGNTHRDGVYQENVRQGLNYLLRAQAQNGSLGGNAEMFEFMYCHGMATCALSEAYGMTRDEQLRKPVERAVGYIVACQDSQGGGWRYKPGMPGDTSQMGWQLMALKSANLAGIPIGESTRQGIIRYLRSVSLGKYGGKACYRPGEQVSRTMSAEALVCWQFLGLSREHPACNEAGDFLLGELPGDGLCNLYYWYYATLGMYQLQGDYWERWNEAMRKSLLSRQVKDGQMAGTWEGDDFWGCHGGRLYTTALATLSLEVYYRYLPLYSGVPAATTAKEQGISSGQVK